MPGGVLVVMDRLGRPSRRFHLSSGLATLGQDPCNDIRITLPEVAPHHATLAVHDASQLAVIRSTGGATLVNGQPVNVAPLQHGDVISVGGRALRWEYLCGRADLPSLPSPMAGVVTVEQGERVRARGRSVPARGTARDRTAQLALEVTNRASMPGNAKAKQVAIVQPQRREGTNQSRWYPLVRRRTNYEPTDPPPHHPGPNEPRTRSALNNELIAPSPSHPGLYNELRTRSGLNNEPETRSSSNSEPRALFHGSNSEPRPPWPGRNSGSNIRSSSNTQPRTPRPGPNTKPRSPRPGPNTEPRAPRHSTNKEPRTHSSPNSEPRTPRPDRNTERRVRSSSNTVPRASRRNRNNEGRARSSSNTEPRAHQGGRNTVPRSRSSPRSEPRAHSNSNSEPRALRRGRNKEPRVRSSSNNEENASRPVPGPGSGPNNYQQRTPVTRRVARAATLQLELTPARPSSLAQTPPQVPLPAKRSLPNTKTTPLRMAVLKKAQSAHKARVIKIEAPSRVDHTKQAAIMLMTGHTLKSKQTISPKNISSSKKSPAYLVKKPSPVRKTPRSKGGRPARESKSTGFDTEVTSATGGKGAEQYALRRSSKRNTNHERSVSVLEITDSTQDLSRSGNRSTLSRKSPKSRLLNPKKSAMKDRFTKSLRKTESITFDLSNLENRSQSVAEMDTTRCESDEDITLRYSESSGHSQSPSPRRSIHSRSSIITGNVTSQIQTPTLSSMPLARKSLRRSAMVQGAMETSDHTRSDLSANTYDSDRTRSDLSAMLASTRTRSRLNEKTINSDRTRSDLSQNTTATDRTRSRLSANMIAPDRTRSRLSTSASLASAFRTRTLSPRHNLESYSVVDLVSLGSEDESKSVYDSADSTNTSQFGTPAVSGRRTRSTMDPVLLGSSTPYAGRPTRSKSSPNATLLANVSHRTSAVSSRRSKSLTTPENGQPVVVTRVPRASRSRSRIHDDLSLLDLTEADDSSPRTSKRTRTNASETIDISNIDMAPADRPDLDGTTTPENRRSPEAVGTPVLSIRSLLESSRGSVASAAKGRKHEQETVAIGPARRSRLRLIPEPAGSDDGMVTPTSAAKPSPESVKNKHSTAKKPQSKRSIIDDLNSSDTVKQLFDSPVKRKLTQSMSEFSRKRLFEDDEEEGPRRLTRRTLASAASAPAFVLTTDESEKHSIINDLVDEVEEESKPRDDLRRVTGVGALFRTSPRNDLTDVRGVRRMFQNQSPANDLRNVSAVKRILRTSPRNDLTDVRGVRTMFQQKRKVSYQDVSGIEELYRSEDNSECDESADKSSDNESEATVDSTETNSSKSSINDNMWRKLFEAELRRSSPTSQPRLKYIVSELRKLATDTVLGGAGRLAPLPRNPAVPSRRRTLPVQRVAPSTPPTRRKRVAPSSVPTRRERVALSTPVQRVASSKPSTRRDLELAIVTSSELSRISPVAPTVHRNSSVPKSTQSRSPQTQTSPTKMGTPKQKKSAGTPRSRATRSRKVAETVPTNTRRLRKSLVVTKKAPVMSPKAGGRAVVADSPKSGTSRTRARAAKAALVVPKPSPKPKRTVTRKPTDKNPVSPIASPKGKRKPRANAHNNETQTNARRTKIEYLAPVEQPTLPKRTRRTKTEESGVGETSKIISSAKKTRRGKVAATKEIEKTQPISRGKNIKNQSVPSEPEQKRPNIRGKMVQTETNVQPKAEEKRSNIRGKKVQFETNLQTEPTTRRGRKTKQKENESKNPVNTIRSPPIVQSQPATRGRRAKPEVAVIETRRGKRKSEEDHFNAIPQPKKSKTAEAPLKKSTSKQRAGLKDDKVENSKQETAKSVRTTRAKPVEEPAKLETTRGKGRKAAEPKENVDLVSKRDKFVNIKQETTKTVRATRAKTAEEPVKLETARARGRKAATPKGKVAESTRGKRKANVDPTPAKAAAKKVAAETITPAPASRPRRAARAKPLPEVATKVARRRRV